MEEHSVSQATATNIQENDNASLVLGPSTGPPSYTNDVSRENDTLDSAEPASVPLTSSNSSSSSADTVLSDSPPDQGSYAAAQRIVSGDEQDIDPSSVPLPASRSVSSLESFLARESALARFNVAVQRPMVGHHVAIETFEDMRAAFQSVLPHVKDMWRVGSVDRARVKISIINAASSTASQKRSRSYTVDERNVQHVKRALISQSSSGDDPRVVIVEDLSPRLIKLIYNAFKPSPEFFEQHLEGSLYGDPEPRHTTEDSLGSKIWSTNLLPRSHCSLRWWRPVMRRHQHGLDDTQWAEFLKHGRTERRVFWAGTKKIEYPSISRLSNIFRAEFDVMARLSDATDNTHEASSMASTNEYSVGNSSAEFDEEEQIGSIDTAVTAWEEKVTIHHSVRNGATSIVVLTDPLPEVSRWTDRDSHLRSWLPFTQVCPRGRPTVTQDGTLDNISNYGQVGDLRRFLNVTRSFRSDFLSWMSTGTWGEGANRQSESWQAILKVIETDTLCFLGIILEKLDRITEGITNEVVLQDRLYEWRPLVARYLLELPRIKASLLEFKSFMTTCEVTGKPHHLIDKLTRPIDDAYSQVEKVYNSLRTEMSIIDSRRGIAEAEGVSKLTELAFVFVPVTFAASIFSMQIKELETAPPLYAFMIAALLCVIVSYAIRLSTRSDILLDSKRRFFDTVRGRYSIPPNKPVSTRKFLAYVSHAVLYTIPSAVISTVFPTHRSGLVGYILVMGATLTTVLALLWTESHLSNFLNASITILSVAMVMISLWWILPHKLSLKRFLVSRLKQSQQRPLLREEDTMSV